MDIDRAQPNLLAGGVEATPIAQLHPEIRDPGSRVVDGVITVTWPYSIVKKSIAFILAEHDVRLRRDRGSLRIEFYGAAGKAVESLGIGAGDRVRLRLEGADWGQNEPNPRLPWTLEWRLRFKSRLHMTIQRDESDEIEIIDVESLAEREQDSPEPDYDLSVLFEAQRQPELKATLPIPISPINIIVSGPENGEYASPAFLKRARVAYGSLLEGGLDWFDDVDGKSKKRRKSRFSMNATWRYSSRSPSPHAEKLSDQSDARSEPEELRQPLETASQPPMVDQGCQTQELGYSLSMGVQVAAESRSTGRIIQSTPTPHWRYEDLSSGANAPLPLSLHHPTTSTPQDNYRQQDINGMRQDAAHMISDHDYDFLHRQHPYTEPISDNAFSTHPAHGDDAVAKYPYLSHDVHAFHTEPLIIDPSLQFHSIDSHHQAYRTGPIEAWEAESAIVAHPTLSMETEITDSENLAKQTPRSPDTEVLGPPYYEEARTSLSNRQDAESQKNESQNAFNSVRAPTDEEQEEEEEAEEGYVDDEGSGDEEEQEEEAEEEEEAESLSFQGHDVKEHHLDFRRQYSQVQEAGSDDMLEQVSDKEEHHRWKTHTQLYDASEEEDDEEDHDDYLRDSNIYARNEYYDDEGEDVSEGEEVEEEEAEDEEEYGSEEEEDEEEEEEEDDFGPIIRNAPSTTHAPKEPVVISLLSDSEDDDNETKAGKEASREKIWTPTVTRFSAKREEGSADEEADAYESFEEDVEMGDGGSASDLDEDAEDNIVDEDSARIAAISGTARRSLSQVDGCDDEIQNDSMEVETHVVIEKHHVDDARSAEETKLPEPVIEESEEAEPHGDASHPAEPTVPQKGKATVAPNEETEEEATYPAEFVQPLSDVDTAAIGPPNTEIAVEVHTHEPTEMKFDIESPNIESGAEKRAKGFDAGQLDVEEIELDEAEDVIEQEDIAMKEAVDEPLTRNLEASGERKFEQYDDEVALRSQNHDETIGNEEKDLIQEVAQEAELELEAAETLKAAPLPAASKHKATRADDSFANAAGLVEQVGEDEDDLAADQQLVEEFSASQPPSCYHSFDGAHDDESPKSQRPERRGRPEPLITAHALRSKCRLHRKSLSAESNNIRDASLSPVRTTPIKQCLVDDDLPTSLWFMPRSRDEFPDPSVALARAAEIASETDDAEKQKISLGGLLRVRGRHSLDPSVLLAQSTSPPSKLRQSSLRRKGDQQDTSVQIQTPTASPRNTRRQNVSPTRSTRVTNSPVSTIADSSLGSESISILKTQLLKSLRASLPDCLPLKGLRNSLNKVTDILAVATTTPAQPHRPKHGPRDYLLEVFLTDPSAAPTAVNVAHIFRPHLSSLPVIHTGDVVLLRRVQVVSMQGRGFGFRAGDASAWAVFERNDEEMLAQIKGPPVEVSDEEVEYAKGLRGWWEALDEKVVEKMDKANRKLSQASNAHDESR